MKIKAPALFLLLVLMSACEIILDTDTRYLPVRQPAALVLKNRVVSYTSTEVVYETDVLLLEIYEGWDNTFLAKEDFQFQGNAKTTVLDFRRVPLSSAGASSSLLLIDASGSYEHTDPYNTRAQAINKFFQDNVPPDNFLPGAFSTQGSLTEEPVEFYTNDFITGEADYTKYLFDLASRTGGGSSLYDALGISIGMFANNSNARKELISLVHAPDAASSTTPLSVIQKAKTNGVRLHMIALGGDAPLMALAAMAHDTGGFFVVCPDEKVMVCVFNQLYRLLNGNPEVYRIRVKVEPQAATIGPGWEWMQTLTITDPQVDYEYNPAYAYVKIP